MPPRTSAVCTQKLHILLVVLVCKFLVAAEEVGIPQLVHLHVWGHVWPSGARGAVRCKPRQRASRARWAQRKQLTDDVDGFGDARDDEQEDDHDENGHHAGTDRYPKNHLRVRARHAREGQARRDGGRSGGCLVERSLRAC